MAADCGRWSGSRFPASPPGFCPRKSLVCSYAQVASRLDLVVLIHFELATWSERHGVPREGVGSQPTGFVSFHIEARAMARTLEAGRRWRNDAAQMSAGGGDCRNVVALAHDADALGVDGDTGAGGKLLRPADLETVGLAVCGARANEEECRKRCKGCRSCDSYGAQPCQEAPPAELRRT